MKDHKPHTAALREGEIVGGKYRIEHALGSGGMGIVVAARHVQLGTKVAIKALLPEMLDNQEAVTRFAREAKAAAKISNDHVVQIFDVGSLRGGAPYMVMEFLEGQDCAAYIEQHGPLPIEQAVAFVSQACVAVAAAHALGIVHRDLKPSNLFCVARSDGQLLVKVLDFGISKVDAWNDAAGSDLSVTLKSIALGCPPYISPEQWRSAKDVDSQTDIWALGVILYELLTGSVPFEGETPAEIAVKVATQAPPPMRERRHDVPASLEQIVLKCLAKVPGDRFRDVAELAAALRAVLAERTVSADARRAGPSIAPMVISRVTATAREGKQVLGRWWNKPKRHRFAQAGGVLATLVALIWIGTHLHGKVPTPITSKPGNSTPRDPIPRATTTSLPSAAIAIPPSEADTVNKAEALVSPRSAAEQIPPTAPSVSAVRPQEPTGGVRARVPQARSVASPARISTPHCDPPYFFDARGNRVFKVECL